MVSFNEEYPNSENPNDELNHPNNEIINTTDTDSDNEEDNPYAGYAPLPLNDFVDENNSTENDEENNEPINPTNLQPSTDSSLPEIKRIDENLLSEVWSGPRPETVNNIEMDSSKIDEVKQVMSNITLPASSIPEWARDISEDQWKLHLMNRLQNIQK